MIARFRSFWQKVKKPLEVFGIIVVYAIGIALIVVIVLAYIFKVNVSGLTGKNLWDWLQLLIIPAVLAVGGYLFNFATSRTEREIALDKQREDALQAYIDSMSELLLHEKLRMSGDDDEVRKIARVRTLTVLPRLDATRKRSVLQFLYESGLIEEGKKIVDLGGTDLRGAHLSAAILVAADLRGADFRGADLRKAVLSRAYLREANFGRANLSGAILSRADLSEVNFGEANLSGAILSPPILSAKDTEERLKVAKSLKGAMMPDGTKHA